ncbi:MAG TPA: DUF6491 family protein [Rhizomicrobium sp.]
MRKLLLLAAVAAVALGTPAYADGTCIRQPDIQNWVSLNDRTLVVENYQHKKILLKLVGTCSEFNFRESIEIRSHGLTRLSCIEAGDDIITRNPGFDGRCSIVSVAPYSGPMTHHPRDEDHDSDHGHNDSHNSY